MIKKLYQKLRHAKFKRLVNKPKYPIHSLYTGRIVYFEKAIPASNGEFAFHYRFRPVKDFAIFTYNYDYSHIISGQKLKELWITNKRDYCIHNLESFAEHPNMKMYMRKHHLTEDSLLSFAQIVALEEAMNKDKTYKNDNDKMFY